MRPLRVHFSASPGRSHNLYLEFTEAPPPGVEYVFPAPGETGFKPQAGAKPPLVDRIRQSDLFRRAYAPVLRNVMGGVGVMDRWNAILRKPRGWDLYHAVGGVHPYPEPWVVGCESVLDFFGMARHPRVEIEEAGARRYVRRKLTSKWCRRILPWTDAARRSILATFPEARDELDAKMEVVPLAIRAGPEPPPRPRDRRPRILFVGSKNFPHDFLPKGGNLALLAFRELRKERDAELVVRASVPEKYRALVDGVEGVRIEDRFLSDDEVRDLYWSADVFLFPAHHTPGMVILEAMRAAMPSVMLDVWGNREILADGASGFLVAPQEGVPYFTRTLAPNWSHEPAFVRAAESNTDRVVADLADRLRRLVDDAPLGERMGRRAREEVVDGRLSIQRRNAALRRVYDDALR